MSNQSSKIFQSLLLLLCAGLFAAGCSGTGKLAEGERLYTGAKVKVSKAEQDWKVKILRKDLKKAVVLPRPNKQFLGIRPKLSIYNTFHNGRKKSFGNFIATRFGEPPVLYNAKIAARHRELLEERAGNDGFFKVKIDTEEKLRKRSARLVHRVRVESPRKTINSVTYPPDSTELLRAIRAQQPKSLVKAGDFYLLENMMGERQRLNDTLRNRGWYYFSPDHLLFVADTVREPGQLNLSLKIKDDVAARDRKRYRIASVTVYPDHDLAQRADTDPYAHDTLPGDCVRYVYHDLNMKPEVLSRQIFLRCGRYYSVLAYQATIYRLLNLNVHKFINIRFEPSARADSLLDARAYLTPYNSQRIEGTLSGVFSPNFYSGVRAGAAYTHRNAFRGAEALRISLNGAYLRTNQDNFDFEDFLVSDAGAQLTLPRFLFIPEKQTRAFNSTKFSLRHEANFFKYNVEELGRFGLSFQRVRAEGGYLWKKNRRGSATQEFNPLSFAIQFSTISDKAVRQQLISGIPTDTTGSSLLLLTFTEYQPNYTYTIDQRLGPAKQFQMYFRQRFSAQASGYTRPAALPADYALSNPLNFFTETEYRQYQNTHKRNVLAFRAIFAAGIPLRNGSTIALLDRYGVGGASSVRAFPPRSVGPGSEVRDAVNDGLNLGQYTGNVLIETSLEYRVPIGKYPELAFFVDAGNVWLTTGSDATEASRFRFDHFYRELALGTGLGLRVNLGFFIVRLDLAFPLNKPYLPIGERWVGDDLRFGSKSWRQDNWNWNFSFGYPF
ncbi:MAG: BamA/TamA family outer membrane protein [Saprospiraceae bacterium]